MHLLTRLMLICIINIYRQIYFSRKTLNKYNNYIIYIPSHEMEAEICLVLHFRMWQGNFRRRIVFIWPGYLQTWSIKSPCKITRDNYHIIPINADPDTYVPDRHQVAKCRIRIIISGMLTVPFFFSLTNILTR